jgi:flavodoxin
MKILVAYYSETGNTEKIAFAIYNSIYAEKEIIKVQDLDNLDGYDLIFFGFPVREHSVPPKAVTGLKKIPEGQKVAFFSTHGSMRGGIKARQAFEHAIGLAAKAKVLGHFGCRGKVPSELLERLEKQFQHRAWAEEAASAFRHPDENDMEDAERFAAEIISMV